MDERTLYLRLGVPMAVLIALVFISPVASAFLAVLGVFFGALAGILNLIRRLPSKPLFAFAGACVVLVFVSSIMAGQRVNDDAPNHQQHRQETHHTRGLELLAAGKYQQAIDEFSWVKGYKDANDKLKEGHKLQLDRVCAAIKEELGEIAERVEPDPARGKRPSPQATF